MKQFIRQKKVIIGILLIVVLILSNIYVKNKQQEISNQYEESKQSEQPKPTEPHEEDTMRFIEKVTKIIGNTYEYESPDLPGRPITMTFENDKTILVCYWEEVDSNYEKTGSAVCDYELNEDASIISIKYPDGRVRNSFEVVNKNKILINGSEYERTNRKVHDI